MEGIKKIDYTDIEYAGEFGYVMKLLAVAEKEGAAQCARTSGTGEIKNTSLPL